MAKAAANSGASVETADVYAYAKSKGAFGGVSAQGGVVQTFGDRNAAYYGKPVSATQIVVDRAVSNPGANGLIGAVSSN